MSSENFFLHKLSESDADVYGAVHNELYRQRNEIELIASENIVSKAVMEAQGSVMTNKYAEGYPAKRYYSGCQYVDEIENLAISRLCKLFRCNFANVQPHSGAQANQAVFLALLKPGDTFLGMDLACGGHLTHGAKPSQSGKWFNAVQYGVSKETEDIDYDQVERLAHEHRPSLIIAGGSAIPRNINFARFKEIAKSVGAYLHVDMAHFAGIAATGYCDNPLDFADVVSTTTHKTLRGPRGGAVLTNSEEIIKKINSAVFPGLQGGPLMHVIAAKAVAFGEALTPAFKDYIGRVKSNASFFADALKKGGVNIVTGGTDTHLFLVDLRPKNVTGAAVDLALANSHITCNKNAVPFDPLPPQVTSGIRIGTPATTTRGFGTEEYAEIADMILEIVNTIAKNNGESDVSVEKAIKSRAISLCDRFPIYPDMK